MSEIQCHWEVPREVDVLVWRENPLPGEGPWNVVDSTESCGFHYHSHSTVILTHSPRREATDFALRRVEICRRWRRICLVWCRVLVVYRRVRRRCFGATGGIELEGELTRLLLPVCCVESCVSELPSQLCGALNCMLKSGMVL